MHSTILAAVALLASVPSDPAPGPLVSVSIDCADWIRVGPEPFAPLTAACATLTLSHHEVENWGLALLWAEATSEAPSPEAKLSLERGVYFDQDAPRPLASLSVDAADAVYRRLLLKALQDLGQSEPGIEERADRAFPSVPEEQRSEALIEGLAEFGSHTIALYSSIHQAFWRAERDGRDLCPHLDRLPLSRLWHAALGGGQFYAWYQVRREDGTLEGRRSRETLPAAEKRWLLDLLFEGSTQGSARVDFLGLFCTDPAPRPER